MTMEAQTAPTPEVRKPIAPNMKVVRIPFVPPPPGTVGFPGYEVVVPMQEQLSMTLNSAPEKLEVDVALPKSQQLVVPGGNSSQAQDMRTQKMHFKLELVEMDLNPGFFKMPIYLAANCPTEISARFIAAYAASQVTSHCVKSLAFM